jgi:hypothetical protein
MSFTRNTTERALTEIVRHKLAEAHERLIESDLPGPEPLLNVHSDPRLPLCVYQPRTNAIAISMPWLRDVPVPEVVDMVKDAMAMCGCHRRYLAEMRAWNETQNKGRMPEPALAMCGTATWRHIRGFLD